MPNSYTSRLAVKVTACAQSSSHASPRNWWDEHAPPNNRRNPSENGYILITAVFMLAIFIIALAVAAPRVAKSIQREREIETMHRGKQYARAVKLYYRRFGRYPPNIAALVNTNEVRFLRKKYIDPTSGKEDWKPISVGQNKTQATGFFGKPLVGTGSTGLSGSPGMAGNLGGANSGSSTFGSSTTFGNPSTASGTNPGASTDPNASATQTPTTDANGNPIPANPNSTTTTTSSAFGTNPTFGGLGIMGFSPNSAKASILLWHKKNHYNEWEFFYDPTADRTMIGGNAGAIGQPAGTGAIGSGPASGNTPGSSSSFGNSSSSFGGTSSTFGSGSNSTPTSPAPQQ
jgi:type II secretory pathway pseudopilin PulG